MMNDDFAVVILRGSTDTKYISVCQQSNEFRITEAMFAEALYTKQ